MKTLLSQVLSGIFYYIRKTKGSRQKKGIFYSQADRKRLPSPLLRSAFCENFFGVFFILDYDSMCAEVDFHQVIFIQLIELPTPPYYHCCSVANWSDTGIAQILKALKIHFCNHSQ